MSRRRPVTGRTRLLVTTLVLTLAVSACRTDEAGTEIVTPTPDAATEVGQPTDGAPEDDDATVAVDAGTEADTDADVGSAPAEDAEPTDGEASSDDPDPAEVTVVMSESEIAELEADLDEIDQLLRDMEQAFADD